MKTRRLGKTNLQVSEIGFGGEWLERHPEEEGIELIHYAASQKGSTFWTAGWPIRNREISSEKESRRTAVSGLFRAISAPPGRTSQYFRTRDMEICPSGF